MSKTVLVFGATGKTGIQLCEALQEKGITHAAFVREGSQGKLTTESTLRLFGDVLNAEQVGHAIGSQPFTDIIVSLGSRELKNNPVRSEGTRNIVEALKAQNLNCRLHVVSAHGVGDSRSQLKGMSKLFANLFLKGTMQEHELQEGLVKENPGGYHIVRPVGLQDGPATGRVATSAEGKLPYNTIKRADVAQFIMDHLIAGSQGSVSISKG